MLILATDTSGKHGSVALVQFEGESVQAIELVPLQGGTFSAQLIPQVAGLLSKHQLSKSDIHGFGVASGPGSFTGLRVGLAAIKALAEILQKPIAAASLLEVIAFEMSKTAEQPKIAIALDAGRGEVFVGEYDVSAELPVCLAESLLSFDELAQRATEFAVIYTPDENVLQNLSSRDGGQNRIVLLDHPNAISIAKLGYRKILAGQTISPEALDATYIRRADAEIKKPTPA